MYKRCLFFLFSGLLLSGTAHAAERLETYELQLRQAGEIIPVIKPMLPAGSAINGQGYTLIVRGDEATHEMVRQILQKLDGKLQNLQISVRFTAPTVAHREASGASVRLHTGDDSARLNATAGNASRHSSTTIDIKGNDASIRAGIDNSTRVEQEDSDYRVRVLEGREAYIQTGITLPYQTRTIYPGGVQQNSIQLHDARSGFYIRPRLNGEQVLLDILPQREQPAGNGRIDTQHVQTTVSGYLGQWIELGGVSTSRQTASGQALASNSSTLNKNTKIFVKVEIIP